MGKALLSFALLILIFLCSHSLAEAQSTQFLTSDSIALSAYKVATQMNRTGRCYEGVCKAMHPLGVELWGEAAYEATGILIRDPRFVPLNISDTSQLRRGDIIVYNKSSRHPYGHIAVYEGNLVEASDHIASVTHTTTYGGATVFRLNNELLADDNVYPGKLNHNANAMINPSQQFSQTQGANLRQASLSSFPPLAPSYLREENRGDEDSRRIVQSAKGLKVLQKHLIRRLIDYVLR